MHIDMETLELDPQDLKRELLGVASLIRDNWVLAVSGKVLPGMKGPVEDRKCSTSLQLPGSIKVVNSITVVIEPIQDGNFPPYGLRPDPPRPITKLGSRPKARILPGQKPKTNPLGGGYNNYLSLRRVATPHMSTPWLQESNRVSDDTVAQAVCDYCIPQVEQNLDKLAEDILR